MSSPSALFVRLRSLSPAAWAGLALFWGIALLYLETLDNGIAFYELHSDLVNHQRAQIGIRLANQPGYPLYTLLGMLWVRWSRLFLGWAMNPIEIFSLYSILWALGALALLYMLILELTERNWIIAALVTLLYAFSFSFWFYAVTTEKNTAGIFQIVAAMWAALRWERTGGDRPLLLLALLTGFALAHVVTGVLIALAFLVVLYPKERPQPGLAWRAALWSILPLISYAYVLVQGHLHPQWRGQGQQGVSTLAWFAHFLTNPDARELLAQGLSLEWPAELVARLTNELTLAGLLLGLLGIVWLGRRRGSFLSLALVGYVIFAYFNRYGSWVEILMPAFPLLSIGIAHAAHQVWRWRSSWTAIGVVVGLTLLAGYQIVRNYPIADQRDKGGDSGLDLARAILADAPPLHARIIITFDEALSLEYLTRVWGERGDILFEPPQNFAWDDPKPFYVTRNAAWVVLRDLPPAVHLSSAGATLIEVRDGPGRGLPASARPLLFDFEGGLRLVGYGVTSSDALRIALYWQARTAMERDYSISVRPTRGGELIFVEGQLLLLDHAHPVWGFYPTSRWEPGEVVRDDYQIPLPADTIPDGIRIVVYYPLPDGFYEVGSLDLPLSINLQGESSSLLEKRAADMGSLAGLRSDLDTQWPQRSAMRAATKAVQPVW